MAREDTPGAPEAAGARPSPPGRRVLVAVVTGEAGARIGAWRERHDPQQARRLPPHVTLCYWAPALAPAEYPLLEAQVRHAFDRPVAVRLGAVDQFDSAEGTFYVQVQATAPLDRARERLYDGTRLLLPRRPSGPDGWWKWHVTCVRDSRGRDLAALRRAAAGLRLELPWVVERVAYLELRGERYLPLREWSVGASPAEIGELEGPRLNVEQRNA
jgi:2'-5' RNA ligase